MTTTAAQVKRSSEPRARAGATAGELRGDLDWITMRALEKDRTRRYGSASDLAADLRRHLENLPIMAGSPSSAYRVRKFVRRHRVGVVASATVVTVLIAFATTTAVQARRVARERDRANREAQAANHVANFMIGLFNTSSPDEARGRSLTAREILDQGATNIERTLADQPAIQARLQATLGSTYVQLGVYPRAEALYGEAVTTSRRVLGPDHPDTIERVYSLGTVLLYEDRYRDAEDAYRDVAERRRRMLGPEARDTLAAEMALASVYVREKRFDEAERLFRSTLDIERRVLGADDALTLTTMNNMSSMFYSQERYADALPLIVKTVDSRRRLLGEDHPRTLNSLNNLATTYEHLGRYPEAEQVYLKTIEAQHRVLGDAHNQTASTRVNLASMYSRLRRFADAEPLALAGYEGFQQALGDDNVQTQKAIKILIDLYSGWDKPDRTAEWRAKLPKGSSANAPARE